MDNVFFLLSSTYFTVYRGGSNGLITEKTILFKVSRGGLTVSRGGGGGGPTFSPGGGGGVLIIIFKETHITCDSPLWIQTCKIAI